MEGEGESLPPKSIFYELMEFTMLIAQRFNLLPFDIMAKDKDSVIMLLNYYLEKAENEPNEQPPQNEKTRGADDKEKRIRVTNATASGGWY